MFVFSAKDLVYDVSVICEKDQAFRVLIKAADVKNPQRVIDKVNDIPFYMSFGGTGDANWLIQGDIDIVLSHPDLFAIYSHIVTWFYLAADFRKLSIDRYAALFNKAVRAAS